MIPSISRNITNTAGTGNGIVDSDTTTTPTGTNINSTAIESTSTLTSTSTSTSGVTTGSPLKQYSYFDVSSWKYTNESQQNNNSLIEVDVIIPVHNASSTLRETIASAMNQVWIQPLPVCVYPTSVVPSDGNASYSHHLDDVLLHTKQQQPPNITMHILCYNDSSTDDSWSILQELYSSYTSRKQDAFPLSSKSTPLSTLSNDAYNNNNNDEKFTTSLWQYPIPTQLWISSSPPGSSAPRGPGYARNRAVQMRDTITTTSTGSISDRCMNHYNSKYQHFICWLDSDDIMHPTRIYHQVHTMMRLVPNIRLQTLLGTNFDRFITTTATDGVHCTSNDNKSNNNHSSSNNINDTITPHYTRWANTLSHDRLYLERYREVTIIQPTWMMCRYRYIHILHGYLECPIVQPCPIEASTCIPNCNLNDDDTPFAQWIKKLSLYPTFVSCLGSDNRYGMEQNQSKQIPWRLVHPEVETIKTIRIAEDLRFFHEHLYHNGMLQRTISDGSLLAYRYRPDVSQSAQTSRKLLLALRVAAFEHTILLNNGTNCDDIWNDQFIVWGAGRDGKDFVKALTPAVRQRVYCFLDVDDTKITRGYYNYIMSRTNKSTKQQHQQQSLNIPIVHFSLAVKDSNHRSRLYKSWTCSSEYDLHVDTKDDLNHGQLLTVSPYFGRIVKNQDPNISIETSLTTQPPPRKRVKMISTNEAKKSPGITNLDLSLLPKLPVVVCVAMYRTNGALENNVRLLERIEGKDLWYFC
jgi:glycosyltransferase involved in cell wall biosynthesis